MIKATPKFDYYKSFFSVSQNLYNRTSSSNRKVVAAVEITASKAAALVVGVFELIEALFKTMANGAIFLANKIAGPKSVTDKSHLNAPQKKSPPPAEEVTTAVTPKPITAQGSIEKTQESESTSRAKTAEEQPTATESDAKKSSIGKQASKQEKKTSEAVKTSPMKLLGLALAATLVGAGIYSSGFFSEKSVAPIQPYVDPASNALNGTQLESTLFSNRSPIEVCPPIMSAQNSTHWHPPLLANWQLLPATQNLGLNTSQQPTDPDCTNCLEKYIPKKDSLQSDFGKPVAIGVAGLGLLMKVVPTVFWQTIHTMFPQTPTWKA